jgi:hypothetical protein
MLRAIDIFKTPIRVTYKSKPDYATNSGILFTIIVLILIIILAVFFSRNIYERLNPNVIVQEETIPFYPNITLTDSNFTMGIKIMDKNNKPWTKDKYENIVQLRSVYAWRDNNTIREIIDMKPCEEVYPNIKNMALDSNNFEGAMCPYNFSFPIYGNPDTGKYGALTIYIFPCMEDADAGIVCQPVDVIKESMKNTQLKILYFDNILYADNYTQPLHQITSAYWEYLDYNIFKNVEFHYKLVNIDTDEGILFESVHSKNAAVFDQKLSTKFLTRVDPELPVFQIDVKAINKLILCKRTYEKIQNVLANMGGMIKILMVAGYIMINMINNTVMKFDMVSFFYDFSQIYESNSKESKIIREAARRGVKYSVLKTNNKFADLSDLINAFHKNNKSSIQQDKSQNNQIELVNKNSDSQKPNLCFDANSHLKNDNMFQLQPLEVDSKREIVELKSKTEDDKSDHSDNKSKKSFHQSEKSLDQSEQSPRNSPRSHDNHNGSQYASNIMIDVSPVDANRFNLNMENELKKSENSKLPNIDISQQIQNLSEEYLLRREKHSVLTNLRYNARDVLCFTIPIKKCWTKKLHRKASILDRAYEDIITVLDISSFMRMTYDINFIKGLFLNEDQIRASNYIKRKVFTEEMLKPELEGEIQAIKKYYKQCTESPSDKLDKKIIENLDDDLIFVLKNC